MKEGGHHTLVCRKSLASSNIDTVQHKGLKRYVASDSGPVKKGCVNLDTVKI